MNVQEIVDRVVEFSLDEVDGETLLSNRVLADLNAVYKEVLLAGADNDLDNLDDDDFILVNGSIALTEDVLQIASVRDLSNRGKLLTKTDILKLEEQYPLLDDTGNPHYWYLTKGAVLNCYPKNNTSVRVRYFAKPEELTLSSVEADIRIPVLHHQVLVDGCIYYMKNREQGFHNELDRREAYQKYKLGITDYLMSVEARARRNRTTAYYDF